MSRPSFADLDHPGYSADPQRFRIFFDTVLTELVADPKLISIGLIDEKGERTFYVESSDTWRLDDVEFAREVVLPQLDGGAALMTMGEWLPAAPSPSTSCGGTATPRGLSPDALRAQTGTSSRWAVVLPVLQRVALPQCICVRKRHRRA